MINQCRHGSLKNGTRRVSWSSWHISTVPSKAFPGENVSVIEGSHTLLRCGVEGNPSPQVIWFASNGIVLQNQTSGTNLTLEDVSRASHGTYRCTVKNYLGCDSGTLHLDVQCKLSNPSRFFPRFVFKSCAMWKWTPLIKVEIKEDHSLTAGKGANGLCPRIHHVRFNLVSTLFSSGIAFTFPDPARVTQISEKVEVVENQAAVLVCEVEGKPTPRVTWTAPNGTVLQDRTGDTNLTLYNVTRGDSGTYVCNATNMRGTESNETLLDVQCEFPMFGLQDVSTTHGRDYELFAAVFAFLSYCHRVGLRRQERTSLDVLCEYRAGIQVYLPLFCYTAKSAQVETRSAFGNTNCFVSSWFKVMETGKTISSGLFLLNVHGAMNSKCIF